MERITIFDTTLRDGEQSPGCSMDISEKLRMAQTLHALGVDVIEAGVLIASQGDFAAVELIGRGIRGPSVAGLARCKREDVERAWQAVRDAERPRIHTFLATSDIHLEFKLKISRAEALQQTREVVSLAKSRCDDVEFSPEDATRSDFDFLCEVLETAIEAGATTLNIPDTVGYTLPAEYGALIANLCKKVGNIDKAVISVHCHDDLGLAVANTLAGIEAGARQVECTINGIGERAGNAPLEEIVLGKHSGRHALQARYAELGYRLNPAEVKETYTRFIELADRKKNIYDQDLLSLLPIERRSARASAAMTNVGAPIVS